MNNVKLKYSGKTRKLSMMLTLTWKWTWVLFIIQLKTIKYF